LAEKGKTCLHWGKGAIPKNLDGNWKKGKTSQIKGKERKSRLRAKLSSIRFQRNNAQDGNGQRKGGGYHKTPLSAAQSATKREPVENGELLGGILKGHSGSNKWKEGRKEWRAQDGPTTAKCGKKQGRCQTEKLLGRKKFEKSKRSNKGEKKKSNDERLGDDFSKYSHYQKKPNWAGEGGVKRKEKEQGREWEESREGTGKSPGNYRKCRGENRQRRRTRVGRGELLLPKTAINKRIKKKTRDSAKKKKRGLSHRGQDQSPSGVNEKRGKRGKVRNCEKKKTFRGQPKKNISRKSR